MWEIESSMYDRFGPLPEECKFIDTSDENKDWPQEGCSRVAINKNYELVLTFQGEQQQVKDSIQQVFQSSRREFQVQYDESVSLRTKLAAIGKKEVALEVIGILSEIEVPNKSGLEPAEKGNIGQRDI